MLLSLTIEGLRHIAPTTLMCSPTLNIISGANGSGKTSILEAIYFLARARSFRTSQIKNIMGYQSSYFRLTGEVEDAQLRQHFIGMQRDHTQLTVRINGQTPSSQADLALLMPVLLITPESQRLITEGPQGRRRFLDWGLFHQHANQHYAAFWGLWRRYQHALNQRNAALKQGAADAVLAPWEIELSTVGMVLNQLRSDFCQELQSVVQPIWHNLLQLETVEIQYRSGFQTEDFAAQLLKDRLLDRKFGYTRHGPHRGDFLIKYAGHAVAQALSRGQNKLAAAALILAQAQMYQKTREAPAILLVDDLTSELDLHHRTRFLHALSNTKSQLFISILEKTELVDDKMWADNTQHWQLQAGSIQ